MTQRATVGESSTIVRAIQVRDLFRQNKVKLKTAEVARRLQIPWSSAKYLLETASLEIPLRQDADKYWQIAADDN